MIGLWIPGSPLRGAPECPARYTRRSPFTVTRLPERVCGQ